MKSLNPEITLQMNLGRQIYNALQGDVVEKIRLQCEGNYWALKTKVESDDALKVDEDVFPNFYHLCQEVKSKLNFTEPIDFYVIPDPTCNACSNFSVDKDQPHIIQFHSAIFSILTETELKAVIGHEIGHLINGDENICNLVKFVYPDPKNTTPYPTYLALRKRLYDLLAELSADRYGYLACDNLEASISMSYKMASGLDLHKMSVNISNLITHNEERLNSLSEFGVYTFDNVHPTMPIRIKALSLFANAHSQAELNEGMESIIEELRDRNEYDRDFARFAAAAGLIVADQDGEIDNNERATILEKIGETELYPKYFLKKIEKGDYNQIFEDSYKLLLEKYSDRNVRNSIITYFVELVLADKKITNDELNVIFNFGHDLGFSDDDISNYLGDQIRSRIVPNVL